MLNRINILKIIKDHLGTLRSLNQSSNRIYWKDLLLFFIFPIIISTFLVWKGYSFKDQLGNLIAAISIFGGFLFNLLAIIYSQMENIKKDVETEDDKVKERFINEIHINISFCIVLSIFIVLTLLLTTIDIPEFDYLEILKKVIIGLNYFLMSLFLLTLTMILNRVYILLKKGVAK
ncbi:hypothetical protein [Tenacibaculum maritimum]|uniref:hypothetical protein n=1 Tax=Tenacibaculum maritimum TaxID=107401 RepID=UPI0010A3EDCE|nr:hypothetical protein [Tenacibaculum maritimum]QCD61598.1 hypothetical protein B9C57_03115 [Tenacibaculum maritimum]QCD61611.1 hypothetical protein B9C57_03185 [Tenacibaculum maritimum]